MGDHYVICECVLERFPRGETLKIAAFSEEIDVEPSNPADLFLQSAAVHQIDH